jgi:hypothetical protein
VSQFRFALQVTCPRCHRSRGHWCRDSHGKCVAPHPERSKEALRITCSVLMPSTKRNFTRQGGGQ